MVQRGILLGGGMVEMVPERGKLFVIEGGDGCGKQTQSKLLVERLLREGYPTVYEEEPTSNGLGAQIRAELAKTKDHLSPLPLQFIFTADRAIHVEQKIEPALSAGTNVVADRYWPSTVAYAKALGVSRGGVNALYHANLEAFPKPNLIFILKLPPEIAAKRMQARGRPIDRHESDLQMQGKLGKAYWELSQMGTFVGAHWHTIDAIKSIEEVANEIYTEASKKLLR